MNAITINTDTQTVLSNGIFNLISIKEMEDAIKQKKEEMANNVFDFICKMTSVKTNDIVEIKLQKTIYDKKTIYAFVKGQNSSGGFDLRPFNLENPFLYFHSLEFLDLNKKVGSKGFIVGNPEDYLTAESHVFSFTLKNKKIKEMFNEIPEELLNGVLEVVYSGENTFHNPNVIRPIGRLDFDKMVFIDYNTNEEKPFLKQF